MVFITQRLALGRVAFPLADLVKATGVGEDADDNQLLRLKDRATRVSPWLSIFSDIVAPKHCAACSAAGGVVAPSVIFNGWVSRIIWRFSRSG